MAKELNSPRMGYLTKRGGSTAISIPPEILQDMDLEIGKAVVLAYKKEKKQLIVEKLKILNEYKFE